MKSIFYFFIIGILLSSCYKEEDYQVSKISSKEVILNVTIENDTILANSVSTTVISVEIPVNADKEKSSVKISTTNGIFTGSNQVDETKEAKLIEDNGKIKKLARFNLRSTTVSGKSIIDVEVDEFKEEFSLYFNYNYPSSVETIPSKLFINPNSGEEIEIKSKIRSSSGSPSVGQDITLLVKDTAMNDIGSFRIYNNKSDSNNESSFVYTMLPDTAYSGKLYVISSTDVPNATLSDTVIIYTLK